MQEQDNGNQVYSEPLAPRSVHGKSALCLRCCNVLKEITNLTYLIKEKESLEQLAGDLADVLQKAKSSAPKKAGIHPIVESPKKSRKRKTANLCRDNPPEKKVNILDVKIAKYGRKKHPFSKRVGQHAAVMRKMYQVHVPVSNVSNMKRNAASTKTEKPPTATATRQSIQSPFSAYPSQLPQTATNLQKSVST